jgi:hypothetical protein
MTDIVERLREWRMHASHKLHADLGTAADEIESLRQQLAECQAQSTKLSERVVGVGEIAINSVSRDRLAECQAREKVQWNTIETAPKHEVFLVSDGEKVSVGWWSGECFANWLPDNRQPTLWRPIPEATLMPSDTTALDTLKRQWQREALLKVANEFGDSEVKAILEHEAKELE